MRLNYVKESFQPGAAFEKWNSFSRVAVFPSFGPEPPFGWGMSEAFQSPQRVQQMAMNIDGAAATVISEFDGNPKSIEYLKYDAINLAHYLRPSARVLVVGVGGGRDILSAH